MADMTIRNAAVLADAAPAERTDVSTPFAAVVVRMARVTLRGLAVFVGVEERRRSAGRSFNDRSAEWALFDPPGGSTSMLSRSPSR